MKKYTLLKSYVWLFLLIPLFASCEIDCPSFNRNSEIQSLSLFPQDRPRYEFLHIDNSGASVLRFERVRYQFSEAYKQTCGLAPCNCFVNHDQSYEEANGELFFDNQMFIIHEADEAISTQINYSINDRTLGASDFAGFDFSLDNTEIRDEVNALLVDELEVVDETFNDVLRLEFIDTNITLFIERDRGLQGILYQDVLYTLIN